MCKKAKTIKVPEHMAKTLRISAKIIGIPAIDLLDMLVGFVDPARNSGRLDCLGPFVESYGYRTQAQAIAAWLRVTPHIPFVIEKSGKRFFAQCSPIQHKSINSA